MLEDLSKIEERYNELNRLLSDSKNIKDPSLYSKYGKEKAEIEEIVFKNKEYQRIKEELGQAQEMLESEEDEELKELAREEVDLKKKQEEKVCEELKLLLIPKDEDEDKNTIVEIRAGTGGEESALFAADLFRMYSKYAQRIGFKVEIMNAHQTGLDGFKEVIFSVQGKGAYGRLRFESGGHRVQRVPVTETSGRIHTSAATVAIMPEAEEVEVEINPAELRIDIFRSSGPGGQSVNTTDSAVRITHLPTGMTVSCQDEKSQHKNKAKALRILRARLLQKTKEEEQLKRALNRKTQVGSGDRSSRIRTYNFPQNRLTDHRIGLTLYKLDAILEGELEEIISSLSIADREERLKKTG